MRTIGGFLLTAAAVAGFAAAAAAQDPETTIGREIERKSRAAEADDGYCSRAGADLVKLTRPQAAEHLNRLLTRPDSEGARLLFVAADLPDGALACAYFVFRPVAMRDGKKCRPTDMFACISGRDCRAKLDDAICEVRPGVWD